MAPLFPSRPSRHPTGFRDRIDAGRQLADRLRPRLARIAADNHDIVIVGLARGGVIVAAEVAQQLGLRLEAIVIRKLGAPSQPELALGALSASGDRIFNEALIDEIDLGDEELQRIVDRAMKAAEILSNEIGAPAVIPDIAGKTVVLVDDGLATGATMRAAIQTVYHQGAGKVIMAVPVGPDTAPEVFGPLVDEIVILLAPDHLRAVGQWYLTFSDVPSAQVRKALEANPLRAAR